MADETIQFSIKNENDEEMKKILRGLSIGAEF